MVNEPLAPRMAHVPHDDETRIFYRDFESFLRDLLERLERDEDVESYFYENDGDYPPDSPRSPQDQKDACLLLSTNGQHDEWNFAVQLLDASNLAEWDRVLETDHFIRRDAVERMGKMSSPAIQRLLANDRSAFEKFIVSVADAAERAGLKVGSRQRDCLQIGGIWINIDAFYYRRNVSDAMPRMFAWISDLIAKRDPRARENHYFAG